MSFALYKRLLPPTAVDHAVTANFTSSQATNLVVARGCVLAVYAVRAGLHAEDDAQNRVARLDLLAEYELSGIVQSLAVVRLPQSKVDSIVASFADAKIAVVEWDPVGFCVRTVSLHFYENEPHLKSGKTQFLLPQIIRVDNDNRCAVVLLYDRHLAVIPFISDSQQTEEGVASTAAKPASSYTIDLQKLGINNVKDFQFINGYYEPTLMFLFESDRTWAGRYVKKKNTCSAAIVSLHVLLKSHTTIWKLDKLPHDCHSVVPLPPPAGGALILSFNEVHYLNQSSTRYRLSLNIFGDEAQAIDGSSHTREKSRIPVCFEASRFTFLDDDTLLVSSHCGDLYALTIVTDGRTVTHIDLQKAGSASLASCMSTVNHELLFIGSRLGDSYLIRFSVKAQTKPTSDSSAANQIESGIPKDFIDPEDYDEEVSELVDIMLRSKKARLLNQERTQFPRWTLQVCDVLPSLAPVASAALERSVDSTNVDEESRTDSKFLELVCASGRGKSGSLSVIQQAIRPSVVTSLELPGCQAMWAVYHSQETVAANSEPNQHKYLIISRANSTMVLQTDEAISEVTNDAEFRVDAPTLNVGNMFGHSRYVQVHEGGFYLVDGLRASQIESLPEDVRVVWSSVCDPYLLLLLSDGSVQLYEASHETGRLRQLLINLDATNPISTCCVFQDNSNTTPFNKRIQEQMEADSAVVDAMDDAEIDEDAKAMAMDPEEIQLYGISTRKSRKRTRSFDAMELDDTTTQDETAHFNSDPCYISPENIHRPFYAAVSRTNGSLEIYELPSFKLVWYSANGLSEGASILLCDADLSSHTTTSLLSKKSKMPVEIAFAPLGSSHLSATLIVLYDTGEMALFRSFSVTSVKNSQTLPLAFKRIHSEILCHNMRKPGGGIAEAIAAAAAAAKKAAMKAEAADNADADEDDIAVNQEDDEDEENEADAEGVDTRIISPHRSRWTHNRITFFRGIQGRTGVFICGLRPVWLLAERDHVRTFLMDLDGPAQAFTPFNNVNCTDGFIYYAQSTAKIKISQLRPGWNYELSLPVLRVPLRATPHKITYDPENETLVVLMSNQIKDNVRYLKPAADDKRDKDREEEMRERGEDPDAIQYRESDVPPRVPPLFDDKYEIRLIDTNNWETTDSYELDGEELGTISRLFLKTSESDYAEFKMLPFIVLTTSTIRGEDSSCKGRICVFEINKESRAGAAPVSRLNLLINKEQKGPVTAAASVEGTLAVAVGQKMYFWHLKNKRDLDMIGFFDTQFLVTNLISVKKYLIVTDMYDSVFFLRWRERVRTVDLLGRDSDHMGATAAGFIMDHEKISMLISDSKNNLNIYAYDPKNLATQKGQKLLCLGNFHTGVFTQHFLKVRLNRLNFPTLGNQFPKYGCVFGAHDGSVGLIAPLNADKFKRLGKLEIRLVSTLPHLCGLNPKAFRLWKPRWHMTHNHQRRFIDGSLLWKFTELDRTTQESLATFVGSSVEELVDDLMELELATRLF